MAPPPLLISKLGLMRPRHCSSFKTADNLFPWETMGVWGLGATELGRRLTIDSGSTFFGLN